jgi:hypothetical protein
MAAIHEQKERTTARHGCFQMKGIQLLVRSVVFLTFLAISTGCSYSTVRDSGELVRHYFGYVKVITPAVHSPNSAVRVLEIENVGFWVAVDRRPAEEDAAGYGTGIGYRHDRREFIPLDCRVVMRVKNADQINSILMLLNEEAREKGGICVVQDTFSGH